MTQSIKILKNLVGEFVTVETVKEATQKEYNQSIWNNTVDRYNKYDEVKFFKTPGTIYEFNYYVIYVVEGIRFLQEISYVSSLTSGGFAFGFFTEGIKDKELLEKLKDVEGLEDLGKDSITILSFTEGRVDVTKETRQFMKLETEELNTRFFTKSF
jgi:hypothetical protein